MNIKLSVKGHSICLNGATEVNDLVKALEYSLAGGLEAKTFGCVVAGDGKRLPNGAQTFSEMPPHYPKEYELTDY